MTRNIDFKIFDINKSFERIKRYYIKNNRINEYSRYIAIAELSHYNSQMEKIVGLNSHKKKEIIYLYFMYCIDVIDKTDILKDDNYSKLLKKIRYKKWLKVIYLSNVYPIFKSLLTR